MAWHYLATVFYAGHSFHFTFQKIAKRTGNCSDSRYYCGMINGKPNKMGQDGHSCNTNKNSANGTFPGFFG